MESNPGERETEEASTSQRRGVPWGLLVLWLVLACAGAGVFAAMFRMPSMWGGRGAVLEYIIPLPLSWGMMHWPGIVVFSVLLSAAYRDPGRWLGLVRLACIGALIGVGASFLLVEALRGFPLLLFVGVDAFAALLVTNLVVVNAGTEFRILSPRMKTAMVLGPAAVVIGALVLGPYLLPRYKFSMSDTLDLSPGRDMLRIWVYSRRGAGDPADECPHLARLADQWRDRHPPRTGERHRAILLFKDRKSIGRAGAGNAWVTFEWWPDGREVCSADADFRR